jgi:hypothetical protein
MENVEPKRNEMRVNNVSNNVGVMSDDTALGVFDSDGGIITVIDSLEKDGIEVKDGNQPFGVRVIYYLGQSTSKTDLVLKVAEKFNGSVSKGKAGARLRVNQSSEVGKRIRLFFSNNKPLHPGTRRDYLISEVIIELLNKKAQKTKEGLVTLVILAYSNTRNVNVEVARKKPLQYWIDKIKPSEAELKAGKGKASLVALELINKEVDALEKQLPLMKLSLDYTRGAHFGDGGFTVALTWKPAPGKTSPIRRRCEPQNRRDGLYQVKTVFIAKLLLILLEVT